MIRGKKILGALLTFTLCFSMVIPAQADDISDAKKKQQELEQQKNTAEAEKSELSSELDSIVSKMEKTQSDLTAKENEINDAETELVTAKANEDDQYQTMKLRIKYMYEAGNDSAFETLVTSEDFTDLLSKAEYVQNVHSYDRKQLQEYVETKQQISDLKDSLEKDQKELESKQVEYEKQGDNLNNLITSKSAEVANLDSEIQAAAEAAAREAAERAAKEAAEKAAREAERQQAAASNNNSASTSNRNNTTSSSTATSNRNNTTSSSSSSSSSASATTKPSNSSSSTTTSGTNANGGSIVSRAYSQLGKPYVWGACGPNSFDCSGFVSYCLTGSYSRLGTTLTFMGWTRVSNPQPGDVVTTATHCGIYIGNGQMIHAPHTGDVVKVGPVQSGMIYVRR